MNLQNILTEIEKVYPEVYDRLDSRRGAMQRFAFAGKVLAAAAVPSAIGSMFKKAYGQNSNKIIEVLNYALTLEYLEYEFYKKGIEQAPIPNATARGALTTIRNHEQAHVNLLRDTIISLGGTPVMFTSSSFDFTEKFIYPFSFSLIRLLRAVFFQPPDQLRI
jgi:hypothetical protein